MRDLLICRICLATDTKLFNLHQYKLVESYEILTQTKVSDSDRLPQHTCSYCSTLLLKSAQFKLKCNKTQDLLKYSLTQQEMPALNYLNTIDHIKQNLVLPYKTVITNKVDITVGIRLDNKIKDEIADWSDKDEDEVITKKLYNKTNNDDVVDDFDISVKMEDGLNEQSPIHQDNTGLFETNTQFDTESKEYVILDSDSDTQVIVSNKDEQFIDSSNGSPENLQRTNVVERPYACTKCPKRFKRPDILQGHLRAHTGERPFKCPDCPKTFTLAFLLRRHRMVHLRELPFRCTECPKAFAFASLLRKHRLSNGSPENLQRTNVVERPYACTECPKRFKRPDILQGHLRAHTGERPFKCPDCPKTFTLAFLLRRHRMVHLRELPFRCTECPKAFAFASLLRKHRLVHPRKQTEERTFRCTECPQAFSLASGLKRHSWVHKGDKPYDCEVCDKSFAQYRSCKLHYLTVHLKQPSPYKYKQKSRAKKPKIDFDDETNIYEDVESGESKVIDEVVEVVMDESEGIDAVKHIEINKYEKERKDQDQVIKYEIFDHKVEDEDSEANYQIYLPKVKFEEKYVTIKEEDVDHNYMAEIATCTGPTKESDVRNVFLDNDHLEQINNESLIRKSVLFGENEVALDNIRPLAKRTYSGKLKKTKEVLLNSENAMISLKDDKLFSQQYNDVAVKIEKPEEMGTVKAKQPNKMHLIKTEKKDQKKIILNGTL